MNLKESDHTKQDRIQTIFVQVDLFLIDHVFWYHQINCVGGGFCVCSWVSKLWILLLVNKPSFVFHEEECTHCFRRKHTSTYTHTQQKCFAVFGSCRIIDITKLATDIKDLIVWSTTPRAFFNLKYVGWASAPLHRSYRCCISP